MFFQETDNLLISYTSQILLPVTFCEFQLRNNTTLSMSTIWTCIFFVLAFFNPIKNLRKLISISNRILSFWFTVCEMKCHDKLESYSITLINCNLFWILAAQQYYIEYGNDLNEERFYNLVPNYIPDYCLQRDNAVDMWHQLVLQAYKKVHTSEQCQFLWISVQF